MGGLLCCRICSSNPPPSEKAPANGTNDENSIDDLLIHPKRIDSKLERKINDWQNAINDYHAYEEICLDELGDEFAAIINHFREHPAKYKDPKRNHPNVVLLANKLLKVNDMQNKLDFSGSMLAAPGSGEGQGKGQQLGHRRVSAAQFDDEDNDTLTTAAMRLSATAAVAIASGVVKTTARRPSSVPATVAEQNKAQMNIQQQAMRPKAEGRDEPTGAAGTALYILHSDSKDGNGGHRGTFISDKLSTTWAHRLNEINPTQGSLFAADSASSTGRGEAGGGEEGEEQAGEGDRGPRSISQPPPVRSSSAVSAVAEGAEGAEEHTVDGSDEERSSGCFFPSKTPQKQHGIKIKPKWPDFLIDTHFDVIKVNKYGHRLRRILKLNQHYVLSIKNGCEISKFYHYRDVRRIWLEDESSIIVVQKNGKHNLYESPIAPHILQQISTRVQVRMSLDKADFSAPVAVGLPSSSPISGPGSVSGSVSSSLLVSYTPSVTASIIRSISEENVLDTEQVMAAFASDLKERAVKSLALEEGVDGEQGTTISEHYAVGAGGEEAESTVEVVGSGAVEQQQEEQEPGAEGKEKIKVARKRRDQDSDDDDDDDDDNCSQDAQEQQQNQQQQQPDKSAAGKVVVVEEELATGLENGYEKPRLMSFREGMPEHAVQAAVRAVIFDAATAEGNTRRAFIDSLKNTSAALQGRLRSTTGPAVGAGAGAGAGMGAVVVNSPLNRSSRHSRSGSAVADVFESSSTTSSGESSGRAGDSGSSADAARLAADCSAALLQVRHFVDGMHEYLLSHRAVSLALLYEREKQRYMIGAAAQAAAAAKRGSAASSLGATAAGGGIDGGGGGSRRLSDLPRTVEQEMAQGQQEMALTSDSIDQALRREWKWGLGGLSRGRSSTSTMAPPTITGMDSTVSTSTVVSSPVLAQSRGQSRALQKEKEKERARDREHGHGRLMKRTSLKFLRENNMGISLIDDATLVFISFIIFTVVEEALFLPLQSHLIALLPATKNKDQDELLVEKMGTFKVRTQAQWGVAESFRSPMGWQSAIFELSQLEHNMTPSSQLHTLTRTVKAIFNEFKHVLLPQLQAQGKTDMYMGADDLVPVFMFVFCQSGLKHPMRNRDLMWALCHPVQLHGEAGYYLTVYESSIEFVLQEPLSSSAFEPAEVEERLTFSSGGDGCTQRNSFEGGVEAKRTKDAKRVRRLSEDTRNPLQQRQQQHDDDESRSKSSQNKQHSSSTMSSFDITSVQVGSDRGASRSEDGGSEAGGGGGVASGLRGRRQRCILCWAQCYRQLLWFCCWGPGTFWRCCCLGGRADRDRQEASGEQNDSCQHPSSQYAMRESFY